MKRRYLQLLPLLTSLSPPRRCPYAMSSTPTTSTLTTSRTGFGLCNWPKRSTSWCWPITGRWPCTWRRRERGWRGSRNWRRNCCEPRSKWRNWRQPDWDTDCPFLYNKYQHALLWSLWEREGLWVVQFLKKKKKEKKCFGAVTNFVLFWLCEISFRTWLSFGNIVPRIHTDNLFTSCRIIRIITPAAIRLCACLC